MTTLSRVKERIETDLSDTELQAMIDEVVAEVELRYGVNAEITVFLDGDRDLAGDRKFLSLVRPDGGGTITVTEIAGTTETLMSANDFRILNGGRTLERLADGDNGASVWERLVRVKYTPVDDGKQRVETIILLVQLGIEYRGLKSEKAGDWNAGFIDYIVEREALISRLTPRRGVLMA